MGEVTQLKVPAEVAEAFRLASVAELRLHGEWVAQMADEQEKRCNHWQ